MQPRAGGGDGLFDTRYFVGRQVVCRVKPDQLIAPAWRRALWVALIVNAAMFVAEVAAGIAAGSAMSCLSR
jgi:hypothetical protein